MLGCTKTRGAAKPWLLLRRHGGQFGNKHCRNRTKNEAAPYPHRVHPRTLSHSGHHQQPTGARHSNSRPISTRPPFSGRQSAPGIQSLAQSAPGRQHASQRRISVGNRANRPINVSLCGHRHLATMNGRNAVRIKSLCLSVCVCAVGGLVRERPAASRGGHGLGRGAGRRVAAAAASGRLRLRLAGLLAVLGLDLSVLRRRCHLLRRAALSAQLLFPARAAGTTPYTSETNQRQCVTIS